LVSQSSFAALTTGTTVMVISCFDFATWRNAAVTGTRAFVGSNGCGSRKS